MSKPKEPMRFDPKAVVANSGTPRKVVNWAMEFIAPILKARLERAVAAAAISAAPKAAPNAEERRNYAVTFRMRAIYGRRWWRSRTHAQQLNNGARETARRRRQIERGLLSPVYRDVPAVGREAA